MSSVVGIIFSENRKKVLLIQRRDVPVWVLPGGGIEANESPEVAVKRELEEETGFIVKIERKVGEYTPVNRLSKYTYFFECSIISGKERLSDETRNIAFFPVDSLPKLLPPPYEMWIEDAKNVQAEPIFKKLTSVNYYTLLKNFLLHPILVFRFVLAKMGFPINS